MYAIYLIDESQDLEKHYNNMKRKRKQKITRSRKTRPPIGSVRFAWI